MENKNIDTKEVLFDTNELLKKLDKLLSSKEGQEMMDKLHLQLNNEQKIVDSQLERFDKKLGKSDEEKRLNFEFVVDIIQMKYNSEKYINRWYSRSIEPPCDLYWFLFEYAQIYGKEPNKKLVKRLIKENKINMFTTEGYIVFGYFISRMDGQGSVIQIDRL